MNQICALVWVSLASCFVICVYESAPVKERIQSTNDGQRSRSWWNAEHFEKEKVPIIPIPHSSRKVSEKDYLTFFPKEVLQNNANYRPVNLRVVEHEDFIDYEFDFVEEPARNPTEKVTATTPVPKTTNSVQQLDAVTFANLLERARKRHRKTTTPITTRVTTTSTTQRSQIKTLISQNRMRHNFLRSKPQLSPIRTSNIYARRPIHYQWRAAKNTSENVLKADNQVSATLITPSPLHTQIIASTESITQSPVNASTAYPVTSPQEIVTNVQTVSALMVTRNVTSTRVVTVPQETNTEDSLSAATVLEDFSTSSDPPETTTEYCLECYEDTTYGHEAQTGHRIPRIIDGSWEEDHEEPLTKKIYSGQYHEVNPGQYHEVNPGQYHEINPGQYYEVNPGQYKHSSVKVELDKTGNKRVYNVQSKVDQFIIGEFGTLSEKSGETLQGVRYTAVADSAVDSDLIYETLHKFFTFS